MIDDRTKVAVWPCGTWCEMSDIRDFRFMGDDYEIRSVVDLSVPEITFSAIIKYRLWGRRLKIFKKITDRIEIDKDGCWIWTGPDSGNGRGGGYGRMNLDGQTVSVHKVMFTTIYGFVPGKKQIDHECEKRRCCRPSCLEMVTHKRNQKRKKKR